MSRLQVLFSQPRLALGALLTLLLAGDAVVGSGATFSASSATATNTFASGTLSLDNSNEDAAILSASNLRPGGPGEAGIVDIKNTGSLSGTFSLTRSALTDTGSTSPLSGKLNVTVVDCGDFGSGDPTCAAGDPVKYSGTLAAMGTSPLGSYAAGEKHRYEFTVDLDGSAGNDYQGGTSGVVFNFNATS